MSREYSQRDSRQDRIAQFEIYTNLLLAERGRVLIDQEAQNGGLGHPPWDAGGFRRRFSSATACMSRRG